MDGSLLVLDFDLTIVYPSSYADLSSRFGYEPDQQQVCDYMLQQLQAAKYKLINCSKFIELIRSALQSKNIWVAVAAFTRYPGAVQAVLLHMGLSQEESNKIIIVAALPPRQQYNEVGKNNHIYDAIVKLKSDKVEISRIVVIDKDANNIQKLHLIRAWFKGDLVSIQAPEPELAFNYAGYVKEAADLLEVTTAGTPRRATVFGTSFYQTRSQVPGSAKTANTVQTTEQLQKQRITDDKAIDVLREILPSVRWLKRRYADNYERVLSLENICATRAEANLIKESILKHYFKTPFVGLEYYTFIKNLEIASTVRDKGMGWTLRVKEPLIELLAKKHDEKQQLQAAAKLR
jgi:hypothetical protein